MGMRDKNLIELTHVCQAWRELFISRTSLWTHLDLNSMSENKIRAYLERSKSSPISLSLRRDNPMLPTDPFFQIFPNTVGRLKSLSIDVETEHPQDITVHLTPPAPLLEHLSISGGRRHLSLHPVLTSGLFNGDLSSLRSLRLDTVRTELPWRNMVNLTSFALRRTPAGEISVAQLDFFGSAPHLREVYLCSVTLSSGAQGGRLVSLTCLKKIQIDDCGLPSVLLDYLLIPVGAELTIKADVLGTLIGDILPRALDNLRNFPNPTTIKLSAWGMDPFMMFSGPNGGVYIYLKNCQVDKICLMLESFAQLDTSETKRLRIQNGNPSSRGPLYQALLPMRGLRALSLYECYSPHIFVRALDPSTSSSEVVVCPKLEELILVLRDGHTDVLYLKGLTRMAEARALKGKKLKTVRIIHKRNKSDPEDVLELRKHVGHVEYDPRVCAFDDW